MSHPDAVYWNQGIDEVPRRTGAVHLMDCSDLLHAFELLGVQLPFGRLLDIGCGTGRLAPHACTYLGADISTDAVLYCFDRDIKAVLIDGPYDLPRKFRADTITCLSVFTHISRPERIAYLEAFYELAPEVIVDILPAPTESGDVVAWYSNTFEFNADVRAAGFHVVKTAIRSAVDMTNHLYYLLRRDDA